MRVLYVCHGHPRWARGGGEIAAWRLFDHFSGLYGAENCGFLAAATRATDLPPGCEVMEVGPREWLIKPSPNAVIHDTAVSLRRGGQLHQAIAALEPQLIHLHHYLHVGIDLVHALRRWFPEALLVLTLHEYWGPCAYEGRLLRRSGALCFGADPDSCNACLGGEVRDQLAIRAQRVQRMFAEIDHFLCPSFFLKQRYLAWGLDLRKLSVVENLPASRDSGPPDRADSQGMTHRGVAELRLAYCGQVNPWKGLDLILEAVALARDRGIAVRLHVHGLGESDLQAGLDDGNPFWIGCAAWIQRLGGAGVELAGSYGPDELPRRLAGMDALVMGSIWFENSPMVIQEAYQHGLPVLAPRLGGMAEKVREGITGLLFEPGEPASLSEVIERLACDRKLLRQLSGQVHAARQNLTRPVRQHERLYRKWARQSSYFFDTQKEKSK